ncbi:restriction endonuclease [Streptomyces sp. NPDC003860]
MSTGEAGRDRGADGRPWWLLEPGDEVKRKELHDRYGGSRQGGISKCAKSPNVLVFTDPSTGHQHGYYDEWAEDGTFHYTGEGQTGPQSLDSTGNAAIRDHVELGLALRVFEGSRGVVTYVGQFAVDPADPYSYGKAPGTGGGPLREVIRFHLVQVGATAPQSAVPVGTDYRTADESVTPAAPRFTPPDPDLAGRNLGAHRRLQNALAEAARARGLEVFSPRVTDPDFDLGWRASADGLTVCEVKSLTESNETRQLRTGIGQLLDYHDRLRGRAADVRAVLWVEREPADPRWVALCARAGITLAWPGREDDVLD